MSTLGGRFESSGSTTTFVALVFGDVLAILMLGWAAWYCFTWWESTGAASLLCGGLLAAVFALAWFWSSWRLFARSPRRVVIEDGGMTVYFLTNRVSGRLTEVAVPADRMSHRRLVVEMGGPGGTRVICFGRLSYGSGIDGLRERVLAEREAARRGL